MTTVPLLRPDEVSITVRAEPVVANTLRQAQGEWRSYINGVSIIHGAATLPGGEVRSTGTVLKNPESRSDDGKGAHERLGMLQIVSNSAHLTNKRLHRPVSKSVSTSSRIRVARTKTLKPEIIRLNFCHAARQGSFVVFASPEANARLVVLVTIVLPKYLARTCTRDRCAKSLTSTR